ncbi:rhamnulokinase [Spirochaeta isovalerica]|uniref:Sugar (Pentulose or hexulose) kinase n=1 Tax=Spirochaeta isovalerica TaxID=150 RepID=A0A841RAB4_9SPIO|nr:FGGY-family carbohydrate kinase [Spirochaeta isovalerica]MBB6480666.1 sugar (pentulose or hexulose) kinase [Spirochaeta isovalerica]
MIHQGNYMALDFGAESGRAIIVSLKDGKAELEEIHRFPNRPVLLGGTLHWDLPYLFNEILTSLKIARIREIPLDSIAVDTWGVDFGLLDCYGDLIGNPVHYRDSRTDDAKADSPMDDEEIFSETGALPWNIGSLFQLKSLKDNKPEQLLRTDAFLNTPDLFNYLLCGEKKSELTIASTSLMADCEGRWSGKILDSFEIPFIFSEIIKPGVVLSTLRSELEDLTGYKGLKVLTTCSHDTASVAAIVPERTGDTAFLSSGTWSILGKINDNALTGLQYLQNGFTNEASLDSWYLCRNITGLYPFQELKREWEHSSDPWDYGKMCREAASAVSKGFVDLEQSDFQSPGHMTEKINRYLAGLNGKREELTRGEAAKVLLDSLALEYAVNLENLEMLSGETIRTLFILGGGIKNTYLCQRTADLCGKRVIAGIDQGTALGNGLVQAYGLGHIGSAGEIRKIAADSFPMREYSPAFQEERKELINIYREMKEIKNENE